MRKLPGAGWKHRQEGTLVGGKPGRRCNRLQKVHHHADQDGDDDEEDNHDADDDDDDGNHLVWGSHCP